MKVIRTDIPEVLVLEPRVFQDERGLFFESYNKRSFRKATGIAPDFVQDNVSRSAKNVIRGLHYQVGRPQGKLIRVVSGRIFDVAVDLRRSSASFRRWIGIELSQVQLVWIPPGFAHGFLVLSDSAEVHYKVTEFWDADSERGLAWNDPDLHIQWPLRGTPILSPKDAAAPILGDAELYP